MQNMFLFVYDTLLLFNAKHHLDTFNAVSFLGQAQPEK